MEKQKMYLVNLNQVCKRKSMGGLGLRKAKATNTLFFDEASLGGYDSTPGSMVLDNGK